MKLAWEEEYKRHGTLWRGIPDVGDIESLVQRGVKILEVGCGNGKTLDQLLERGYDAVGIDVAREALKFGGRNLVSDVRQLPFSNSSFDAVVCRFVLEHLYERERAQAIAEMRRVLRQSGLLFLTAFSTEDMRCSQSKKNPPVEQNTFKRASGIIYHYFTELELRNLLGKFQILDFKASRQKKIFCGEEYVRANFSIAAAKGEAFDRNEEQ
ncbi:MAG: class I SAM-dependent methyltransferase [Candidatus Hydrothermarchaeota archaeon]|nr:class I SAM-dependent methyltransferase [Candidatus Hydrothermarchaeota archaeon]